MDDGAEVAGEGGRAGVPVGRIFFQAFQTDRFKVARDRVNDLARRGRRLIQQLGEQCGAIGGDKWRPTGEQFIKHGTDAIDVDRWGRLVPLPEACSGGM